MQLGSPVPPPVDKKNEYYKKGYKDALGKKEHDNEAIYLRSDREQYTYGYRDGEKDMEAGTDSTAGDPENVDGGRKRRKTRKTRKHRKHTKKSRKHRK